MTTTCDPFAGAMLRFAETHGLLPRGARVLTALSGGRDSMALLTRYAPFNYVSLNKDETSAQTLSRVAKYMEGLGLSPDVLDAFPFQLSGGMRQRAVIALATFMSPNVVLADEPTTALDVVVQRGILMMLMRLQKQFKNTLVIVSHDMGVHYQITDRMGIMYSGSFVELGPTQAIFDDPIHPYTKMLIGALPRVGDKSQKVGIPGRPPALKNPPPGCRFAARCPQATDKCRQDPAPEFREIKPGRFAACHYLESEVN